MNKFFNFINSFCGKLYLSIENEGFELLEKIGNINEDIFDIAPLNIIFSDELKQIVFLFTIFIIFLFLCFYSLKLILFLYKDNLSVSIYHFILRIVIVGIICTNSFQICKEIVIINSNITDAIDLLSNEFIKEKIEFINLKENVDTIEDFLKLQDKINIKGIGESIICAFILGMLVLFSVRYVIIILCIILSPFCIIFSLSRRTDKIFIFWIKLFISNLLIQNINKIMLFLVVVSKKEKEITGTIVIGVIILMYKLNKKVGDIIFWKE